MSRFVTEGSKEEYSTETNDAWLKAKQEVEALKKPKPTTQEDGKSLYETLQANKEKKEAEFQESQRLKNQFQALDEDDVGFLDSVLDSERAREAAVKKDTAEQLETFRRQRELAEKEARERAVEDGKENESSTGDIWTKKRRRRDTEQAGPSVQKVRRTSSSTSHEAVDTANDTLSRWKQPSSNSNAGPSKAAVSTIISAPPSPSTTGPRIIKSGLVAYGSDDDDD